MKLLFLVAAISLAILVVAPTELSSQSTTKVGILAPDRGLQSWLGDQMKAGTLYAIDESISTACITDTQPELELVFAGGAQADHYSVNRAVEILLEQHVDVIIGGSTITDATILRSVVSEREIPSILLAESSISDENRGKFGDDVPHILQIGLSQEDVYRVAFEKWLELVGGINSLSAVYEENDALTQKYAAAITPELLQKLGINSQFYKIPYKSTRKPQYDGVIQEINDIDPDALIVSGSAFDIKNLIYKAAVDLEIGPKPIYVVPPFGVEEQTLRIIDYAYAPIYFGAQFWPDEADACTQSFIEKVRSHLNWQAGAPPSILAIRAYDAVQVVKEAWKDGEFSGWEKVKSVEGITGPLTLQDDHVTMAGPTRVIVSDPSTGMTTWDAWLPRVVE